MAIISSGAGGWTRLWPPGSRNRQADSDTDSEHRRLREEREEVATSDDDLESHISVADVPEIDEMDSETVVNSSEAIDPDETISEDEAGEPRLARNGYNDTVHDYLDLFKKLQLSEGFYERFFIFIKEFREEDDVKAVLVAGTQQGIKDAAGEFLERYGSSIWKLKGKNCQQDRKRYGEILFDIKRDLDRLIPILDELWFRVRDLLYTNAQPASDSVASSPSTEKPPLRHRRSREMPRWPAPFTSPAPVKTRQTAQEQEIAVTFLNKVRKEIQKVPGQVVPRPKEDLWSK